VPSPAPTPALVFREGPLAGRRFPVETQLVLGRENTDVIVEDPEVSRQHALLRRAGEALEISDLRSANGTFVNGQRIGERGELHDGDIVKIGMTTIRIEIPAPSRDPDATVVSRR
jgi:pSer/pThr/pTyr-binding forkhead associated (FHA) protein